MEDDNELKNKQMGQTPREVANEEEANSNSISRCSNEKQGSGIGSIMNIKGPHGVKDIVEAAIAVASIAVASAAAAMITSLEATLQTPRETTAEAELSTKATGWTTGSTGWAKSNGPMDHAIKVATRRT